MKTFKEQFVAGEVFLNDIDQWIENWHNGATDWYDDVELHEFLGMTLQEYGTWLKNPEQLEAILLER